jgi:hypothetical protein
MYGGSYSGIIQYLVASLPATRTGDVPAAPPHLAAVAPQRAYGDLYRDIVYHGGQVIGSFGEVWATGTTAFYTQPPMDLPGMAATEAWVDHITKNDPMMLNYLSHPYVDATYTSDDSTPAYSQKLYEDSSILPRVGNLRVPTLHLAGFFDAFTRGQLMTFNQAYGLEKAAAPGARGPNFLIAGPWNHSGTHFITPDAGFRAYLSDWYRYWLEGRATGAPAPGWIASGFDGDGARVHYFRTSSGKVNSATPADGAWVDATDWPPPGIDVQNLHLSAGGALTGANLTDLSVDAYASNPTAGTAEILSRWDNAASGSVPMPQWDQRTETGKGLTYQTDVLVDGMRVAGPIGLRLWATVSGIADGVPDDTGLTQLVPPYLDTDFVVKLSDVAPDGTATLVTQGYLRASAIAYDADRSTVLDGEVLAPYHLHTRAALSPPVDGEARAYQIEIWPTAKTFEPGHRIRLDIYSADTPNHLTLLKPTLNEISHGGAFDSYLSLPVLPSP